MPLNDNGKVRKGIGVAAVGTALLISLAWWPVQRGLTYIVEAHDAAIKSELKQLEMEARLKQVDERDKSVRNETRLDSLQSRLEANEQTLTRIVGLANERTKTLARLEDDVKELRQELRQLREDLRRRRALSESDNTAEGPPK